MPGNLLLVAINTATYYRVVSWRHLASKREKLGFCVDYWT